MSNHRELPRIEGAPPFFSGRFGMPEINYSRVYHLSSNSYKERRVTSSSLIPLRHEIEMVCGRHLSQDESRSQTGVYGGGTTRCFSWFSTEAIALSLLTNPLLTHRSTPSTSCWYISPTHQGSLTWPGRDGGRVGWVRCGLVKMCGETNHFFISADSFSANHNISVGEGVTFVPGVCRGLDTSS